MNKSRLIVLIFQFYPHVVWIRKILLLRNEIIRNQNLNEPKYFLFNSIICWYSILYEKALFKNSYYNISFLRWCDVCLLNPNEYEMQILLDICNNYSKNWAIEYNISKCKYMVFGSHKFNNNIFLLDSRPLSFSTLTLNT